MNKLTPYHYFTPMHVAWLYVRKARGRDVLRADLDSIEAAYPEAVNDLLFREYRAKAAAGTLRRKPGPKPLTGLKYLRLWWARFEIEEEVAVIWARRQSGTGRREQYALEPCYAASDSVARRMKFHCTGQWLYQRLSKLRML